MIITYPDIGLRRQCWNVTYFDEELELIIKEMFTEMHENNGVGLAANQIGYKKNIIVFVNKEGDDVVLINPFIDKAGGRRIKGVESCLSLPDKPVVVERWEHIKVRITDIQGNVKVRTYRGVIARIIQHEVDHLLGRLIIDYLKENKEG